MDQPPETCWRVVDAYVRVSLTPAEVFGGNARRAAARRAFGSLLMRYHEGLGGVVVAQRGGLQIGKDALAPSNPASPFIHVLATAKLLVFAPPTGITLLGTVVHVGPDHVGLALWSTFHVVLRLADTGINYSYDPQQQKWSAPGGEACDMTVGAVVRFSVGAMHHTHAGIFHVAATFLDTDGTRQQELCVQPDLPGEISDDDVIMSEEEPPAVPSETNSSTDDREVAALPAITPLKPLINSEAFLVNADFDDALALERTPSVTKSKRKESRKGKKSSKKSVSKSKRKKRESMVEDASQLRKDEETPVVKTEETFAFEADIGSEATGSMAAAGKDVARTSSRKKKKHKKAKGTGTTVNESSTGIATPNLSKSNAHSPEPRREQPKPVERGTVEKSSKKRKRSGDCDVLSGGVGVNGESANRTSSSSGKKEKKRHRKMESSVDSPGVKPMEFGSKVINGGDNIVEPTGRASTSAAEITKDKSAKKLKKEKKRRNSLSTLKGRLSLPSSQR